VPQDYKEAVSWYRKAAEQGVGDAQNKLADCYYYGLGVVKDEVEAYAYWDLSGKAVQDVRDEILESMSEAQIAAGRERAREIMITMLAKVHQVRSSDPR
jgi:hypothetical protein